LGISTLYQSLASPNAKVITLEGSPETSKAAGANFDMIRAKSIQRITGNFDETIPALSDSVSQVDYVFMDGNHKKQPTLDYFRLLSRKSHTGTVFVLDDIRWSKEMKEAWLSIIKEPQVTVSIDLFSMGIVFFKLNQAKEHFVLRF
jgi:predicted O-methyltransferase YrrM